MDHSVKAMHRKAAFSRLLRGRRFENADLEQLYQRYTFKLQQSSIASVLGLLVTLNVTLASIDLAYRRGSPSLLGLLHLVHGLLFLGAFSFMALRRLEDSALLALCHGALALASTFSLLSMPWSVGDGFWQLRRGSPADGLWELLFVLFLAYTMLPVRTRVALLLGTALCAVHTLCAVFCAHVPPGQDRTVQAPRKLNGESALASVFWNGWGGGNMYSNSRLGQDGAPSSGCPRAALTAEANAAGHYRCSCAARTHRSALGRAWVNDVTRLRKSVPASACVLFLLRRGKPLIEGQDVPCTAGRRPTRTDVTGTFDELSRPVVVGLAEAVGSMRRAVSESLVGRFL
ncbi:hypothetical protein HPB50_018561 [Hyalomma asiaticum]|uniref:Uncharacterized protein n=1 Tax=Hyalomma asiaticum TaxID=266040 RepID=A0ACB7SZQ8_HYAAI|nr:hypothetical protein HPB50_018561 [Hyalomma asiaticum]